MNRKQQKVQFVRNLLQGSNGAFFGVYFIKRTNGKGRKMNAQLTPKGVERKRYRFNPAERDLLPAYDMQKHAWRFIPLDNVLEVTVNGVTYDFREYSVPIEPEANTVRWEPEPDRTFQEVQDEMDMYFA